MKEILKSKIMLLFIVFVLGVTYINSTSISRFEEKSLNNEYVVNIK